MIEHKFDLNTHMGGWYIPENICDNVIKYFEENKDKQASGLSGGKLDLDKKDSLDIEIKPNSVLTEYEVALFDVMKEYRKKYDNLHNQSSYSLNSNWNIQYYKPNGGFKKWHCENSYGNESVKSRILAFMTYLNDVDDGGTDFLYQNLTSPAKKGLTLIWPAYWTHTHKGQISKINEKYIATGWFDDDDLWMTKIFQQKIKKIMHQQK